MREFCGSTFEVLSAATQRGDLVPTEPTFALYRRSPPETLNLEVGFLVTVDFTGGRLGGTSSIEASKLPGGRCAAALRSDYNLLPQAWEEFMEGISAQGVTQGMPF
ncbi:hypothetical protein ACUY3L_02635 [Corynebacterium mastitidis]